MVSLVRNDPSVAVLIPSMRPHKIVEVATSLRNATRESPHHLYFMIGDDESERICLDHGYTYWRDNGDTWGHRLNFMFTQTSEPYVFLGADDILFRSNWCLAAIKAMRYRGGVVSVNDNQSSVGTLALVSRQYIDEESGCVDTPGVIIYPGYHHNFSERELYETAASRGHFSYCLQSVVEHIHPLSNKAAQDAVYDLGQSRWNEDIALFASRRHLWNGADISLDPAVVTAY